VEEVFFYKNAMKKNYFIGIGEVDMDCPTEEQRRRLLQIGCIFEEQKNLKKGKKYEKDPFPAVLPPVQPDGHGPMDTPIPADNHPIGDEHSPEPND
jgi:hypothetical protein